MRLTLTGTTKRVKKPLIEQPFGKLLHDGNEGQFVYIRLGLNATLQINLRASANSRLVRDVLLYNMLFELYPEGTTLEIVQ